MVLPNRARRTRQSRKRKWFGPDNYKTKKVWQTDIKSLKLFKEEEVTKRRKIVIAIYFYLFLRSASWESLLNLQLWAAICGANIHIRWHQVTKIPLSSTTIKLPSVANTIPHCVTNIIPPCVANIYNLVTLIL